MYDNYIVIGILVLLLGSIIFYLIRAKKKGQKCIGCPYAKQCSGKYGDNNQTGHNN